MREAGVAQGFTAHAVRAGGVGAEVAARGVAGAEPGGGGGPLEHHGRGDPLAIRQARLAWQHNFNGIKHNINELRNLSLVINPETLRLAVVSDRWTDYYFSDRLLFLKEGMKCTF